MNDLVTINGAKLTPTSAEFGDGLELDIRQWGDIGRALCSLNAASQWWIGDWVNYGERTYQKNKEALSFFGKEILGEQNGYELATIKQYSFVCRHVKPLLRINGLSFSHHREVAGAAPEDQEKWLRRAFAGDDGKKWSVGRLREEMRSGLKEIDEEIVDPCPTITKYMTNAICWLGAEDGKQPIEQWNKERCELVLMCIQKIKPFETRLVDRILTLK